jgi:hypothetical protein
VIFQKRTDLVEGEASVEEAVVAYHEWTKRDFHRYAALLRKSCCISYSVGYTSGRGVFTTREFGSLVRVSRRKVTHSGIG